MRMLPGILCTIAATITSEADWLTISAAAISGDNEQHEVTITAAANTATVARIGRKYVTLGDFIDTGVL